MQEKACEKVSSLSKKKEKNEMGSLELLHGFSSS